MKKLKVLSINEDTQLSSGYACYSRGILTELNKNPNFDVAEMALFYNPVLHDRSKDKWKVYPCIPKELQALNGRTDTPELVEKWKNWNGDVRNSLGMSLLEDILLEAQPDVVILNNDEFNIKFVVESPFRRFFNTVWLAATDSEPQQPEWINTMSHCSAILSYSEWGMNEIKKRSDKVNVMGFASPSCQENFQPLVKAEVRQKFGIDQNAKVIGTVMRNQKRKKFPELMRAFRTYLDKTNDQNTYLYLHTKYPDGGYVIPSLLQEFDITHRTLFTYSCLNCGNVFCGLYQDIAQCKNCGQLSAQMPGTANGVSTDDLCQIYNLFDVYVQYANAEGFGLPMVEAASCGIPLFVVDYSAMKDGVKFLGAEPIRVAGLYRELETNLDRAVPDNDHLVSLLQNFFSKPTSVRNSYGMRAKFAYEQNYSWEKAGKVWADAILGSYKEKPSWNSPVRIHTPAKLTEHHLRKLTNIEYARWLMTEVAGLYDMVGEYRETELIRCLNYNCRANTPSNGGNLHYNREMAYQEYFNIGETKRIREIQRGQHFGLI